MDDSLDDALERGPVPVPPQDPNDLRVSRVCGHRLAPPHPCRRGCGRTVRQAWWKGDRIELLLDLEGPTDPASVDPSWPAWWWTDRVGLMPRLARFDREHPRQELHVMHPCERPEHRPAPPTREAPPPMTAPLQFGTPKATGDQVDQHAIKNRLLLIKVTEIVHGMVTKATKPGETTSAVRCDIVALDNGDEHPDALLFGKALVSAFEAGVTYLGVITKVDGKTEGRDHPWLFEGKQDDAASVAAATNYYAYKASSSLGAPATPAAAPPAPPAPAFAPPPAAAAPPWLTTPAA